MSKAFDWVIGNLDFVITIVVAMAVGALVSVEYIPDGQLSITTLGVLITLTLFFAVKSYRLGNKVNSISESLLNIERRVGGITSTRILSGTEEFFRSLNSLICEDTKLDVTYFSPMPAEVLIGNEAEKYWRNLASHLRKNPNFRVRRIATIESLEKLEWLRQTIDDSKNSPHYHLAALGIKQPFPLLNLVIVDEKYVVMFGPHLQASDSHYILIDNPGVAKVAKEYFEELWRDAKKLKVGHEFYDNVFQDIERELRCIPNS